MSNTILTIDMITAESLRILHQKCNFITNLNLQYDDAFAKGGGAQIGATLRVRKPAKYSIRTGATLSAQAHTETKVDLPLATQLGVDVNFTSAEMTLNLGDFSKRILEPAISVLAANVEKTVMGVLFDKAENAILATTAVDFADVNSARELLTYNLAPQDNLRTMTWTPGHTTDFLNDTKGLFQDSSQIATQYKEGALGRIGGFNHFENTINPLHVVGAVQTGTPLTAGSVQDGATISTDGWTDETVSVTKGDIVTFATVNACHPETKTDLGFLKQFVITADTEATTAGGIDMPVSPAVVISGAFQNTIIVGSSTGGVPDGEAVVVLGTASASYQRSIAYHRDFGAVVFADLVMPEGVDMASRMVMDGISMRIVRQYDITNDKLPCRVDVLFGTAALYGELGCTVWL